MTRLSQRVALVATMLLLAVGAMWAQPGGGGRGPGDGGGGDDRFMRNPHPEMQLQRCLGTLDLTQEQKDAIKAIQDRMANLQQTTAREIAELNRQLRQAHDAGDRAAVEAIMQQIKEKNDALHAAGEAANEAILAILTDAQKASLKDCMGQRGGGQGQGGDRGRHLGPMDCFAKLDLTQDQKDAIQALRQQFMTDNQDLMHQIRDLHKQLHDARKDGDTDAVAALRAQIEELMGTLRSAQETLRDQILGVLTPEQKAELDDCMEHHGGPHGGMPNTERPELR
jgi:Spy/CpxP family protein refolding chaperone